MRDICTTAALPYFRIAPVSTSVSEEGEEVTDFKDDDDDDGDLTCASAPPRFRKTDAGDDDDELVYFFCRLVLATPGVTANP